MKTRFLALIAAFSCLLGVMLTVITGHVVSAFFDYDVAIFSMSSTAVTLTVVPDPSGTGPSAERSALINQAMRELVASGDATVILDAQGADGPRIGVYDPEGKYGHMVFSEGRGFSAEDYTSDVPVAIINQDSYLASKQDVAADESHGIIGRYDATSTSFSADYIYNLFTQENVHGIYYVDSPDDAIATNLAAIAERNGYLAKVQQLSDTALGVLASDRLSLAYAVAMALVYSSLALFSINYASANARRFRIHEMFGATSAQFTLSAVPLVMVATAAGTAVGIAGTLPFLASLGTLSLVPGFGHSLFILLGNVAIVAVIFGSSVVARTSMLRTR